jgi:hypothetical protein
LEGDATEDDNDDHRKPTEGGRKKGAAASKVGGKGKSNVAVKGKAGWLAESSKGKKRAGPSKGLRGSKAPPHKRRKKVGHLLILFI